MKNKTVALFVQHDKSIISKAFQNRMCFLFLKFIYFSSSYILSIIYEVYDSCTADCSRYGTTYTVYRNMAMNTQSIEYFDITLLGCKSHCSTLPSCRGFNYFPFNGGQCRLVSDTPYTQPHYYIHNSGVDFYIRNCS